MSVAIFAVVGVVAAVAAGADAGSKCGHVWGVCGVGLVVVVGAAALQVQMQELCVWVQVHIVLMLGRWMVITGGCGGYWGW